MGISQEKQRPVSLMRLAVRTSELDSFGHVNHAVHLSYLEHARFHALKEAGFDESMVVKR